MFSITNYPVLELAAVAAITFLLLASIVALTVAGRVVPASLTTALGALIGWLSRSAAANGKDAFLQLMKNEKAAQ